jgi:hypothetical protein
MVDGKAVMLSAKNTYAFTNVTAPHSMTVNFIAAK